MSDTVSIPVVNDGSGFPLESNVTLPGSRSFGSWNRVYGKRTSVIGGGNVVHASDSLVIGSGNINNQGGSNHLTVGNVNTNTGFATLCVGRFNTVSAAYASVAGGVSNQASGTQSFVAGGGANWATATGSFCANQDNQASGTYSSAIGTCGLSSRYGEFSHSGLGTSSGRAGLFQHGWLVFSNQSSSATPVILYLDGTLATQRAVLAAGARWKCVLEIIAATTGAINKSASWEYKFQIDRPTTAASTVIRTTPALITSDGSNSGAPPAGWAVAITADTTNGCPQVQVTGDTDTINWTASLHYVQTIRV